MAGRGTLHYQGSLGAGFFQNAHQVSVQNSTMVSIDTNSYQRANEYHLIESLAQHTIAGAEFDSAARFPPPSCHPGTRSDITARLQSWLSAGHRDKRLLWLQGPAGVGKSAIIQTLAESECESTNFILGATIFFSRPSGRDDPQRVFLSIAYQLAVQYAPYRHYIAELLTRDPKLVDKSITEQFRRLVTNPFVERELLNEHHGECILVMLDGLDECMGEGAQCEIVFLIGEFALRHPTVPIIWVIGSRPEPHIRVAFASISAVTLELEVAVNSAQGRLDVIQYLQDKFALIRKKYPASFPSSLVKWPTDAQFAKIVSRASGLFIFASTIIRFVDDLVYGNPVSRLQRVLDVIDSGSQVDAPDGPFSILDALYKEIMASVPSEILPITKSILGFVLPVMVNRPPFVVVCNWLNLSQADAYGALHRLYAVLKIPPPEAEKDDLRVFHTSFVDFLISPSRAGRFCVDEREAGKLIFYSSLRVLSASHNPTEGCIQISRIPLSWPAASQGSQIRNGLFWSSLYQVLVVKVEILDKDARTAALRSISFFDDLDFGVIESTFTSTTTWDLLDAYHQSVFLPDLRRRKALQVVPVQALDLECINFEKIRVVCVAKDTCEVDTTSSPSSDPLPEVMVLLKEFWRHLMLANKSSSSPKAAFLPSSWSDDPSWGVFMRNCVLDALTPSAGAQSAVLYGKPDKRWALFQVENEDDNWLCFAPYG